jgi:hypothetical protein
MNFQIAWRLFCDLRLNKPTPVKRLLKGLTFDRMGILENLMRTSFEEETLFDVISTARETISEMNLEPSGECSICLENFIEISNLYKLNCFHLYHNECIFRYLKENLENILKENKKLPDSHKIPEILRCPVCRYELKIPFEDILEFKILKKNDDLEVELDQFRDISNISKGWLFSPMKILEYFGSTEISKYRFLSRSNLLFIELKVAFILVSSTHSSNDDNLKKYFDYIEQII